MRAVVLALAVALGGCSAAAEEAGTCPGVRAGWLVPADGLPHLVLLNRVSVSGTGALKWNGVAISRERLREYLGFVRKMEPLPFTILQPASDVDCAFLEAVRDDLARTVPCDQGYCGEGRGRWDEGSYRPRPLSPEAERERANLIADIEQEVDAMMGNAESPRR